MAILVALSYFSVCCVLSISNISYTKCSNIVSMCTPSSNCTIVDFVHLLARATHSSSKSFVGLGPFQAQYCGCCPNLIKCSHTISTNLGLDLPRQRLHGHLSFYSFNFYAQDNFCTHNLSSRCFCPSMSSSWSYISFAKFAK
jgi:hypothetical protein